MLIRSYMAFCQICHSQSMCNGRSLIYLRYDSLLLEVANDYTWAKADKLACRQCCCNYNRGTRWMRLSFLHAFRQCFHQTYMCCIHAPRTACRTSQLSAPTDLISCPSGRTTGVWQPGPKTSAQSEAHGRPPASPGECYVKV